MKGYAFEVFTTEDMAFFRTARLLVSGLPAKVDEQWVRCHELARLVAELVPGLEVQDGSYGAVEHSWCVLPSKAILDVYVPGGYPQVQLADARWVGSPTRYRAGEIRADIRQNVLHRLRTVALPLMGPHPAAEDRIVFSGEQWVMPNPQQVADRLERKRELVSSLTRKQEPIQVCPHENTRHDACSNDRYCHDCDSIIEVAGKEVEPIRLAAYRFQKAAAKKPSYYCPHHEKCVDATETARRQGGGFTHVGCGAIVDVTMVDA